MKDQTDRGRWIALLLAISIGLYLCWLMLRPFITVLEWSVVLVIVFFPIHKRISRRIKRRGLSAFLSCMLVVVVFIAPLTFVTIAVVKEVATAAHIFPSYLTQNLDPATTMVGKLSEWIHQRLTLDPAASQAWLMAQVNNVASAVLRESLGLVGNVVAGFFKAFFVIFTMYYLFRDGDQIVHALPIVLPFSKEQSETIITRTSEVINASVYGVVTIAMLQGALAGLAFWVLGVPSPILWAVVLTFVCMVPIAASFIVWLPVAIFLITTGHLIKGILLILWGALVISTVDNFLRPRLIKSGTKLHELFIFFSVLGGISVFGLLGIVIGPMVLAITLALLQTFSSRTDETGSVSSSAAGIETGRTEAVRQECVASQYCS